MSLQDRKPCRAPLHGREHRVGEGDGREERREDADPLERAPLLVARHLDVERRVNVALRDQHRTGVLQSQTRADIATKRLEAGIQGPTRGERTFW